MVWSCKRVALCLYMAARAVCVVVRWFSCLVFHRGKYGVVFRCTTSDTKTPCAVKVMLKKGNKREDVLREADVLRKLDHPVVMKMHDFMECDKEYVLSMEL